MRSSYTTKSCVIKGAGVRHRKLSVHQRAELAVDAVTAARPFVPSNGQASQIFAVPPATLSEHVATRRKLSGNGGNGVNNNGHGNGHAEHAAPATPAPDPNRFVRDDQLAGLIAALDATIEILTRLRERS